jgi:hypothetical protein
MDIMETGSIINPSDGGGAIACFVDNCGLKMYLKDINRAGVMVQVVEHSIISMRH